MSTLEEDIYLALFGNQRAGVTGLIEWRTLVDGRLERMENSIDEVSHNVSALAIDVEKLTRMFEKYIGDERTKGKDQSSMENAVSRVAVAAIVIVLVSIANTMGVSPFTLFELVGHLIQ